MVEKTGYDDDDDDVTSNENQEPVTENLNQLK